MNKFWIIAAQLEDNAVAFPTFPKTQQIFETLEDAKRACAYALNSNRQNMIIMESVVEATYVKEPVKYEEMKVEVKP